jgi:hypothetical protein
LIWILPKTLSTIVQTPKVVIKHTNPLREGKTLSSLSKEKTAMATKPTHSSYHRRSAWGAAMEEGG